jgi:hypothetical protein
VTALSDQAPELGKLWPNSFWFFGTMTGAAKGFVETITKLRSEGKIGNTVAMLSVADQFGIGLAKAARRAPKKSGFDLVYDRSYTVEPQDMRNFDRGDASQSGFVCRLQLSTGHNCDHRTSARMELQSQGLPHRSRDRVPAL